MGRRGVGRHRWGRVHGVWGRIRSSPGHRGTDEEMDGTSEMSSGVGGF